MQLEITKPGILVQNMERIGISIDEKLLAGFDELIARRSYPNRSEAVRDLVRKEISEERLQDPETEAVAAVLLVYDHHSARLSQRLMDIQHDHLLSTISSMHVHISHRDCLEVIVLRGKVGQIKHLADNLVSLKGVKLGRVNLVAAGH